MKKSKITQRGLSLLVCLALLICHVPLHASAAPLSAHTNADTQFENTTIAEAARVVFNGTTVLEGGTLEDNSFTFRLYSTDSSFDVNGTAAQLIASAQNTDGKFSFERTFSTTGTYYFVVLEDTQTQPVADVVYDRTQHGFTVQVKDIGTGQLQATVFDLTTGHSHGSAASVDTELTFTNAVFGEVARKEVYRSDDTTTQIDGQQVEPGSTLTYFITYTNYNGTEVVVNILDTIPEYTTYVDGSASHQGGYTDDHINWIMHVAPGRTVTVSFDVVVNDPEIIVSNTAEVHDGINTYHTNEVVNHTIEKASAANYRSIPSSNPPTDDHIQLPLLFALLAFSCGGLITLLAYRRKQIVIE